MYRNVADAEEPTAVNDDCPAVGGSAALRMGRTPCRYIDAGPPFIR